MATQIDEQQQENAAVEEQADKLLNGGDLVDQEAMNMNDMLDGLRITDKDKNSNEAKEEGKEEEPNGKGNEEKLVLRFYANLIKKLGKYSVVESAMIRVMMI